VFKVDAAGLDLARGRGTFLDPSRSHQKVSIWRTVVSKVKRPVLLQSHATGSQSASKTENRKQKKLEAVSREYLPKCGYLTVTGGM
jgi:hypothetical protein